MKDAPPPIVFAELIAQLRREGFAIGTSHYLRLQQLLPHVADLPPEQIRTVLCPLFARNAEEQARFYRVYDEFLARRLRAAADDVRPVVREPARPRRTRRALWIAIAAALLVALLPLLFRAPEPLARLERSTGATGTTRIVVRSPRTVPRPALSPRTAIERTRELAAKHPILTAAAAVLLLALILELGRSFSRLLDRRRHEGNGRPFAWPLRADDATAEPFASPAFADAVRLLRGREWSGQQRLDIPRTLRASIRALGHLVPVYREGQRPPEYLMLIERRSERDHLAAYFDALAAALARAGVLVERAYFPASDPRRATAELRSRFPDHRLLLCAGSPSVLLDPLTGEPEPWVEGAFPWRQRGLLLADEVAFAGSLRRLRFAVGEATVAGLRAVAEAWQFPDDARRRTMPSLPSVASDPPLEHVRDVLSPAARKLLVRCAAHATLEWPLTCALLTPGLDAMEAERILLELSRLAWFRGGSIPPRDRERLVEELNASEDALAVREIVVRVLEHARPPKDSAAARAREVALVAQRMFLDRQLRTRFRRDARVLRRYPPVMIGADLPLVNLLRRAPTTRVWRRVHRSVRHVIFPFASPALGFRPFVGLALLPFVTLVLFFAGALTARSPETPAFAGGDSGGKGVSADLPPAPRVQTETATVTATTTTNAPPGETPAVATTQEVAVEAAEPTVFQPEDLPIPEGVLPQPATESASPSPLAEGLPAPVLKTPVGRVDVQVGTSGPIDFTWTPYGAYELVVWKDVPRGEPIHRQRIAGVTLTWRPESLDPAATYWWTLHSPVVPSTLEPQSFTLNHVAPQDLLARNEADQRARSREAERELIIALPCDRSPAAPYETGSETVSFLRGPNETIVAAKAEVTYQFLVTAPRVGATVSDDVVSVEYSFQVTSFTCEAPPRARVKVTATIGPRIR